MAVVRRILLVITDLEIGGTPTVVRELAARLNLIPHVKCEVASLKELGPVGQQLRAGQVQVHPFGGRGWSNAFSVMTQLIDLVRFGRFDTVFSFLVHANAMSAAASRFFARGSVRWLQSIQTTQPSPHWHWRLQARAHERAERIIVPSPSISQVAHQLAHIPLEKFQVIPNAIDPDAFRIERMYSTHGFRVGFIGRLDPIKRIPDLLHAIKLLNASGGGGVHLHIFGAGAEHDSITATIAQLGLREIVTMHGPVPRPQDALRQIDALVLPSSAEGFGLVLIEAMAAGVPVIGTNAPGIRDVVRNGETGLLVPVGSSQELAEAIRRVREDSPLRHRLVRHAQDDVRNRFTWAAVLPQYVELLEIDAATPPVVG
ncbi:MAG TPA: glycosyltransferase family 4 protein [Tepidisphaeraceae bacterium]|nr:glycosyltransferase family 4 protein [Tepidisphaeraceae bacterium]